MDVQAAAPPQVVSSTRQCVCGGWTRYVVCQYCGTTDPHVSAAGMVSIKPLVQLTPEQAVVHSAQVAQAGPPLPGWGYDADGASTAPAFAAAAPALPPTTFAEAQFGAAPSAAAVFASTAEPAHADLPSAYIEPIPGWSDQPVAAPSGWSTVPSAAPIEPQQYQAPAFEAPASAFTPTLPAEEAFEPAVAYQDAPQQYDAPQYDAPQYDAPQYDASHYEAAQYDAPQHFEAAQYDAPQQYEAGPAYPMSALTAAGATNPWPDPVIPTVASGEADEEPIAVKTGRRALPRWAIFAAAGVVVAAAGGAYLYTQSGSSSSSSAPIVVHHTLSISAAAPAGWTLTGSAKPLTGATLTAADKLHRPAELTAAGVTSGSLQTFSGPGSLKVTALTETAATPAQATTLASETRQAGYVPPSIVRGVTVITLRAPSDAAGYTSALPGWAARLRD